jgi:23S rRNA (cytosine1962-C5)-methyltransferase
MVYANPSSLITARVLSRRKEEIDEDFFRGRIEAAAARRERLYPGKSSYRLVYGESDFLPGLVVDRYGDYLAVQTLTAGMERFRDMIVGLLGELLAPKGIYLRNDSHARAQEGLPEEKRELMPSVPDLVEIESRGLRFLVDIPNGQKTGFFLDQENNRELIQRYSDSGGTVLDLYCYSGAWGLHALSAGASRVVAVDSSRSALALAEKNAALNGFQGAFEPVKDSVINFLKKTRDLYDTVVIDPPAFVKSKAQLKEGLRGYTDVGRRAILRLKPGGTLITCSCSHHVSAQDFEEVTRNAAVAAGRDLLVLDRRGQGPDHPMLLSMPETSYLKVMAARIA